MTILGSGRKIGGIAGSSLSGTISNCINYNTVSGEMYSGGICGYSQNTTFELCGNTTDVYIESTYGYTGGIVRIYREPSYFGICC